MTKTPFVIAALAAASLIAAPAAHAQSRAAQPAWYVGGGLGYQKTVDPFIGFGNANPGAGFLADRSETSAKAFAGFNINRHLAVEAGYVFLGDKFGGRGEVANPPGATQSVYGRVAGFSLGLLARAPLSERFNVFGRLGVARLKTDVTATLATGSAELRENWSSSRFALVYGVGAEYDVTRSFAIRAEWETYKNATNSQTLSIGGESIDFMGITGSAILRF